MEPQTQKHDNNETLADTVQVQDLSDDFLNEAGLVKVSAFIRNGQSANARRVRKAREKANSSGVNQLNVLLPATAHGQFKALACEVRAGSDMQTALTQALSTEVKKADAGATVRIASAHILANEQRAIQKLLSLSGWRRLVARFLGLL